MNSKSKILIIILVSLSLSFMRSNATHVYFDPPPTGDWVISAEESYSDVTINLKGALIIEDNGSLTLSNVDLIFDGNAEGAANLEFNITVLDGGSLTIISGSHLTTDDPTYLSTIKIYQGGTFSISDSSIDNFGSGTTGAIDVKSDDVIIDNCEIESGGDGVFVYNATGVQIINNEIMTSTISTMRCIRLELANETIIRSNHLENIDSGYGILLSNSHRVVIENNYVTNDETSNQVLILIMNVYSDIVISNNYLNNIGSYMAIKFVLSMVNEIKGITITNNTINSPKYTAIAFTGMGSVEGIIIDGNTIASDSGGGIDLGNSKDVEITNNNLTVNSFGITSYNYLDGNLTISGNTITSGSQGIEIYAGYDGSAPQIPSITDNLFVSVNDSAINVKGLPTLIVSNNVVEQMIYENDYYGAIQLEECNNSVISENQISQFEGFGINLINSHDCEITNNSITDSPSSSGGINVSRANNLLIDHNIITGIGGSGIYCDETPSLSLTDNSITRCSSHGVHLIHSDNTILLRNTVYGCIIVSFYILHSDNVIFLDNDAINSQYGLYAYACESLSVTQSSLIGHQQYGLYIDVSSNFLVDEVTVSENGFGLLVISTDAGEVTNSLFSNNEQSGVYVGSGTFEVEFSFNVIIENIKGIECYGYQNTFFNNTIMYNNIGAYLSTNSHENVFYFNYFVENSEQANDYSTTKDNEWYYYITALTSHFGNYWSDYDGIDVVAPFGIGDTQYDITANGDVADLHPLMESFAIIDPPEVSSPSDFFILHGTTGNKVSWIVSSIFTAITYEIVVDGVSVESGFVTGQIVTFSLDGFDEGVHNVSIIVTDPLGQEVIDKVVVNVLSQEDYDAHNEATDTTDTTDSLLEDIDLVSIGIGFGGALVLLVIVKMIGKLFGGKKKK